MTSPVAHDWSAWSCRCRLVVTDPTVLREAVRVTTAVLREVELACSRFRPDSELFTLQCDSDGWAALSRTLADLLDAALLAAERTDGAVDPTVGATLIDLGYDRDIDAVRRHPAPVVVCRTPVGWRSIERDDDRVRMPAGTQLDLGAIAKAWAADRAAARVAEATGAGCLVSLGGDIATAGPSDPWQVRVQDLSYDVAVQVSLTAGGALATSSTARRSWSRGGAATHHLIDPRTARPAVGPWRSASVVATNCVAANTVSTATLVKGPAGLGWLRNQGLDARLVSHAGTACLLGGWPAEVAAA